MTASLVLVEAGLARLGGHHHRTLHALAAAADAIVVAPGGIAPDTAASLTAEGITVVTGPTGPTPRALAAAAAALNRAACWAAAWRRFGAPSRLPHQVRLLARAATEAWAVRTGRARAHPGATVAILSASEALHAATAALAGPHVRIVHEVNTTPGAFVRALERSCAKARRHTVALAPTAAVANDLAACSPGLKIRVRAFAADAACPVTGRERAAARASLEIGSAQTAIALVGGWWPYKDLDVIEAALAKTSQPLHLLAAGAPVDKSRLAAWQTTGGHRVHYLGGPVTETVLRRLYAAADATVVARRPGVGKESGLVADALTFAVPLIVSDHDAHLTARLDGQPWARVFPAGDATALARLLDGLVRAPMPAPPAAAAAQLGFATPADQVAYLESVFATTGSRP